MPLDLRPTSFELQIAKVNPNENTIKQLDVLGEILHIVESKTDMQQINIQGFERNTPSRYTITLDTRDQRNTDGLLCEKPNCLDFTYKTSHADIQGGCITISGIPIEYPNTQIQELLAKTVDIINIKHGTYRQYPTIKNGLRHITYRKQYTLIPTTLRLPEGLIASTEEEGTSQGCFVCKGNHLKQKCLYNQITEDESEIVKNIETNTTSTTKQTHQSGPDNKGETKPSKNFTVEADDLNENQDMKGDKDNWTFEESQKQRTENPQPTYDHLMTSTPAYKGTEKEIIQNSVSSTYSSHEDSTTLLNRMEELIHCMQSQHKKQHNLEEVSITEIAPPRDIKMGKADILSITYRKKSGKGSNISTHHYRVHDPLIIANFDLLLTEQDIEKEKQEEYVTSPIDIDETNNKHEQNKQKK